MRASYITELRRSESGQIRLDVVVSFDGCMMNIEKDCSYIDIESKHRILSPIPLQRRQFGRQFIVWCWLPFPLMPLVP